MAQAPVQRPQVEAGGDRAVGQGQGAVDDGPGAVGLQGDEAGAVAHQGGEGGVRPVHPDFVHGREIGRRGGPGQGHAGVDAGVGAVAVEKQPGVRVPVVGLGAAHPQDPVPVRGLGQIGELHVVRARRRGLVEGEDPGQGVEAAGGLRPVHLDAFHTGGLLGQLVGGRAVGGVGNAPPVRQPVDLLQSRAASGGVGSRDHQGDIGLHGLGGQAGDAAGGDAGLGNLEVALVRQGVQRPAEGEEVNPGGFGPKGPQEKSRRRKAGAVPAEELDVVPVVAVGSRRRGGHGQKLLLPQKTGPEASDFLVLQIKAEGQLQGPDAGSQGQKAPVGDGEVHHLRRLAPVPPGALPQAPQGPDGNGMSGHNASPCMK